ncbi:MAG: UDP-glucose 4-epimerase GalE [Pseudomonadota bacterium]
MASFLIVGGAGYIGSHMVRALIEGGHEVTVLDDLSRGHRAAVPAGVLVEGDLGDGALLDSLFAQRPIDCVMHFAAFALVGESVDEPLRYYRNNTAKTLELLDAMRRAGIDRFIFSSTAATYGEPEHLPIAEGHPTRPTNPYGHSKRFVEQVLDDCERAWGLRSVRLRYFNAAGAHTSGEIGEDHAPETHLIPLLLQVALGQRPHLSVFGTDWDTRDGTCLRDYIHVEDLCAAHLLAAEHLAQGGGSRTYNLGNERGTTVLEVAGAARRVTGHPIPLVDAPRRAGDPARLVASSALIQAELGWRPRLGDPEDIVQSAWRWHRAHPHGYRT